MRNTANPINSTPNKTPNNQTPIPNHTKQNKKS